MDAVTWQCTASLGFLHKGLLNKAQHSSEFHPCFEKIKHIFIFSVPKLRSTQKEQRFQNMPEITKKCNTRTEHARRLLTASTNGKITGITEKITFYKQGMTSSF